MNINKIQEKKLNISINIICDSDNINSVKTKTIIDIIKSL